VPRALPPSPSPIVVQAAAPLLRDPVRAVRVEAARALVGVDPSSLTQEQRSSFDSARRELVAMEMVDADRPEAHLNLGLLNLRSQMPAEAEAEYRTSLRLDPSFVPALVNLADLERMRGRDQQGADLLRKAVAMEPSNADIRHSLGLVLVRQHSYIEALDQLRQASELAPDNVRYAYVYAIALNSAGAVDQALALLTRTHRQRPADPDVLSALISVTRGRGDFASALLYAREMAALYPSDMQVRALVLDLEKRQAK
jgi:Tfp pilus assembly protein PilF